MTRSKKLPNISKKKDTRFSKKIVTLVIVLNVIFTILFLYAFIKTSAEPTGLITAWFSFSTGELWMLSGIKKTELKNSQNDNSDRSEG